MAFARNFEPGFIASQMRFEQEEQIGAIAARVFVECLCAMCVIDREIKEEEIALITVILDRLFTGQIEEETVLSICRGFDREDIERLLVMLETQSDYFAFDFKKLIIQFCVLISASDGAIAEREAELLWRIAMALGLSTEQLTMIVDEVVEMATSRES